MSFTPLLSWRTLRRISWSRGCALWRRAQREASEAPQPCCLSWRTRWHRQPPASRTPRARYSESGRLGWGGGLVTGRAEGCWFSPQVSYIEDRIAALNAAGMQGDRRRRVMTFVSVRWWLEAPEWTPSHLLLLFLPPVRHPHTCQETFPQPSYK